MRALCFLLLPALFVWLYILFVQARGPFYLSPNVDPDYAYLCNSLNIATGHSPRHTDHPGTSLQLAGAITILAAHPFSSSAERIQAVLTRPESHLQGINFVLAGTYLACLALIGLWVWMRTGEWQPALLLQATPFLLGDQFRFLARVSAEPLLLIVGLLIAGLLFLDARAERTAPRTIAAMGILAALGAVTKISFLPFALVPLICLQNWKQRCAYALCASASAFVLLLPAAGHLSRFVGFVTGLIFRQGMYGRGEAGILPAQYFSNVLRLFVESPWLCLVVGLSWATVLYSCMRWSRETPQQRRWLLLLGGVALGQTLEMLMVAKFAVWRYLLPALMFCALNLLVLSQFWGARIVRIRPMLFAASFLAVLGAALGLRSHYAQYAETIAGRQEIAHALQTKYKQEPLAIYYGGSTPSYALWFGNFWAGGHYKTSLAKILESPRPEYWIRGAGGDLFLMGEKVATLRELGRLHSSFLLVGAISMAPQMAGLLPAEAKREQLLTRGNELLQHVSLPPPAGE